MWLPSLWFLASAACSFCRSYRLLLVSPTYAECCPAWWHCLHVVQYVRLVWGQFGVPSSSCAHTVHASLSQLPSDQGSDLVRTLYNCAPFRSMIFTLFFSTLFRSCSFALSAVAGDPPGVLHTNITEAGSLWSRSLLLCFVLLGLLLLPLPLFSFSLLMGVSL